MLKYYRKEKKHLQRKGKQKYKKMAGESEEEKFLKIFMIFIYFLPRQDFPLFNENICWIRNVAKHRGIFHAIYKASCTSRSWIDRGENRWIAQKHWKVLCWKGIVENPTIYIIKCEILWMCVQLVFLKNNFGLYNRIYLAVY